MKRSIATILAGLFTLGVAIAGAQLLDADPALASTPRVAPSRPAAVSPAPPHLDGRNAAPAPATERESAAASRR